MRQQRPRGSTTRAAVVSAALDVVDSVGVDALTIRAVARAVGAPPMSLYSHFANKEELLDLMYAEIARRLYPDSGHVTWQAELSALGRHMRATLLQHPRWTPLLSRHKAPLVMPVRDRLLRSMVESGVATADALPILSAVFLVVLGLCLAELQLRQPDGASEPMLGFERLEAELASRAPRAGEGVATEAAARRDAVLTTENLDLAETFELALETLIAGVSARRGLA